jgi:hypothetical protein
MTQKTNTPQSNLAAVAGSHLPQPAPANPGAVVPPLVDEREAARILCRAVGSLRRDRLLGQGCRYVKLGAMIRYRPRDIDAWVEQCVVETRQPAA